MVFSFGRFGSLAHPIHDRTGRFPIHHVAKRYEVGGETFPAVLEGAKWREMRDVIEGNTYSDTLKRSASFDKLLPCSG